jgi:hypothetical protein
MKVDKPSFCDIHTPEADKKATVGRERYQAFKTDKQKNFFWLQKIPFPSLIY